MPLDFADEALWPIARPASANRKPRGIVTEGGINSVDAALANRATRAAENALCEAGGYGAVALAVDGHLFADWSDFGL
jgi:hypothetical protein